MPLDLLPGTGSALAAQEAGEVVGEYSHEASINQHQAINQVLLKGVYILLASPRFVRKAISCWAHEKPAEKPFPSNSPR